MIELVACGAWLKVVNLFCNTGRLLSTSQRPTQESLAKFDQLFERLKSIPIQSTLQSLYLNHICIAHPKETLRTTPTVEHLRLAEPLIVSHHHNYVSNLLSSTSLSICPTVEHVDFYDVLDTFHKHDPSFDFFMFLYPNIRSVQFDIQAAQQDDAGSLLNFLRRCRGLTQFELELTAVQSGFDDRFYADLVDIPSLRTLTRLVLCEFKRRVTRTIDFDRLFTTFTYIRRFHTNLVAKADVLPFLDRIRICSTFSFRFPHLQTPNDAVLVEVRRYEPRKRGDKDEYKATSKKWMPEKRWTRASEDTERTTLEKAKDLVRSYLENAKDEEIV